MTQGFPVSNGYAPQGGPRALPLSFDFTNVASYSLDLVQEVERNEINMVQSIFVDNGNNANTLVIIFDQTLQPIRVPAGAQGIWPVITPKDAPRFVISTTQAAVVVNIILLNVPMPLTQWGPVAVTVNNVNATFTYSQQRDGSRCCRHGCGSGYHGRKCSAETCCHRKPVNVRKQSVHKLWRGCNTEPGTGRAEQHRNSARGLLR